jgi:hypothetical protein
MASVIMVMLMLFMCQYFTYVKQTDILDKVFFVPNSAPYHECVWGGGGKTPCSLNPDTRWR